MCNLSDPNVDADALSITPSYLDGIIFIYVGTPVCVLGCLLCFTSAYVLSNDQFKENFFCYLKLECIIMGINLLVKAFDCLGPLYFCACGDCSYLSETITRIFHVGFFTFFPSPNEASALVADIFAALNCLIMIQTHRSRFDQFITGLNPYLTMLVTFAVFSFMFSYLLLLNSFVYRVDFIVRNRVYFDVITFSIRDGVVLAVLVVLNCTIGWKVRMSLNKKMQITENTSKERTRRSQQRMSIMVFADCMNSIIGRIPILTYFVLKNINDTIIDNFPLTGIACLGVYLSYFLKFFIFYKFNKRFRLVAGEKLPFVRYLCSGCNNRLRSEMSSIA